MLKFYKSTISKPLLRELDSFKVGSWIYCYSPSHEEFKKVSERFKLDYELLLEGLDDNELPRYYCDEKNHYIFAKTGHKDKNKLMTLLIVLGPDFIMTVSRYKVEEFEPILENKFEFITTQRLKSLIKILDLVDEGIQKDVIDVVKEVQKKKKDTKSLKEKDIEELLDVEDYLNSLVSMYYYSSILYSKLSKNLRFYEEDKELLMDLIIETEEGLNLCKNSLKTITNIRNNYSIILSNRLNKSIQVLTILTITLNIPTVIAGIYGMNVLLPLQNNRYAFYIILIISLFIMVSFLFIAKKREWY